MVEVKKEAEEIFTKAVELHNKGRFNEARGLYEKVIKLDESNVRARVLLGNILYHMGKGEDAESNYRKAIELDPNHAIAYFNIGIIRQDRGDLDGAVEFYEKTREKNPKYSQAYSSLGAILRDKGDLLGAFKNFKKALELEEGAKLPKEEMAKILGRVQEEVRRRDLIREAEELLIEGGAMAESGNLERAIEVYKRAIELNPTYLIGYYLLGLAYEKMGDSKLAGETYNRIVDIDPNVGFKEASPEPIKLLERLAGVPLLGLGGLSKTATAFRDRLREKPKETTSFWNFARQAAKPEKWEGFLRQGMKKESTGDIDDAIEEYKKAIEANPKIPVPYYLLGLALESKGDPDGAFENYQRAAALDSDLLAPHVSWDLSGLLSDRLGGAQMNTAESLEILGAFRKQANKKGAVPLKEFVVKRLERKSIEELREGYLLDVGGDATRAVQKFRQATRIDPHNVLAYLLLGLAQESIDKPEEALQQYKKIDQIDLSRAIRDVPEDIKDIINKYMAKTTESGHKVGAVLAKYADLVAKSPDKMLELLGYIEDIQLDSVSNIMRTALKGGVVLESGAKIIRDVDDFPVEPSEEEKLAAKQAAGVGADLVAMVWKYKTARTIRSIAFDPLKKGVLAGSETGVLYHLDDKGGLLRKVNFEAGVVDLDVSRGAAIAAVALQNGVVKQIDLKKYSVLWEVNLANSRPRSVSISSDGNYVAVGLEDSNVARLSRGKVEWMRATRGFISKVGISNDGRTIVAASDDGDLYMVRERMGLAPMVESIPIKKPLRAMAVTGDGKYMVAATDDGDIYMFDEKKNLLWKQEIGQATYGLGIDANGIYVVAGSSNGKVFLYDRSGKLLWEYSTGDNIWSADMTEDGKTIVLGCGLVFGGVYMMRSAA